MKNLLLAIIVAVTTSTGFSAVSYAQEWPTKPVKIVVPFGPGGPNDLMARELAKELTQNLGQRFVVENRPGAASIIGLDYVAKSPNDGYTFLFTSGNMTALPATKKTPYDTKTAFEPISKIGETPFLLLVRKDFPAKTLNELIAYAKENPGLINYGTAGKGDIVELMTENFSRQVGIKLTPVPYQSAAASSTDLAAGHIDMLFTSPGTVKNTIASELPKLAITSSTRNPEFPELATVKEQTETDYVFSIWFGVLGPAGVDTKIVNKLNFEINKIVSTSEFTNFLINRGVTPQTSSPGELKELLITDVDRWSSTAESIGILPE
jgi:tripartite-type tricarboxylate transporter receptor subunit TctC